MFSAARWITCLAMLSLLVGSLRIAMAEALQESGIDHKGLNWASGGRGYDEQHFSPLSQISVNNVSKLGLAWSLDLPGEHTLEATPLEVDGVLYFSGQMAKVYAVEATTGKLIWTFDPESYKTRPGHQRLLFPANRGVAYWDGNVFVGSLDGRLISLDAKSGRLRWSVQTLDPNSKSYIAGQPRTFDGKVVIGNGGADYGDRGYLTAYDAATGKQLWRVYTAPGDPSKGFESDAMAMAAKTWGGEYWKTGTGGSVWDGITYDPELNQLYIGCGNSGPYNPELRSPGGGDNLFLASILAVKADTGAYVWHYQVNPREAWDFKATAGMELTTLTINGASRRVLMQSPTNGFFYVIDRETGKLLSAEKIGKVTWASRINLQTGRPVEADNIRYQSGPVTFWPSPYGTHNWQPMSYSPKTNLVYIPYMKIAARYEKSEHPTFGSGTLFSIVKVDPDDGTGALLAWDPVGQKPKWRVPRDKMWNGGTAVTAGNLVFQGDADGIFHAHDARDGKELWRYDAKLGIVGAPITYQVADTQFVSVLVGFGGATAIQGSFLRTGWKYNLQPRRLLTFALNKSAALPDTAPPDFSVKPIVDASLKIDHDAAARGEASYAKRACLICHGIDLKSPGVPGPDLRESAIAANITSLTTVLRTGALEQHGMPRFPELDDSEINSLYMYIRKGALDAKRGVKDAAKTDTHF